MIFAEFDETGKALGFYPSEVWPVPPAGAVQITMEQYELLVSDQRRRFINGEVVDPPEVE